MNKGCITKDMPCLSSVVSGDIEGCKTECSGLYADVEHLHENPLTGKDMEQFLGLAEAYMIYKENFATLRKFDPQNRSLGEIKKVFGVSKLKNQLLIIYLCRLHGGGSGSFIC